MTDDIVTRLRGETPVQTRPCIRGGCCEICESILDSAHEAADEIERLRKQNTVLFDAVRALTNGKSFYFTESLGKTVTMDAQNSWTEPLND